MNDVYNDYYTKDTSKKIRAVVKMRGEAGEHLASNPPYGYTKSLKFKKRMENPKENQRIFEGTQPAIIEMVQWE